MNNKNFEDLAKEILTDEEIKESKTNAYLKYVFMEEISKTIKQAMEKEKVGFNQLVKRINTSPTQLNKILRGNANLTLTSLIKVCTALGIEPHLDFKKVS